MIELLKKIHWALLLLTVVLLPFLYERPLKILMTCLIISFVLVRKQYKEITPSLERVGVLLVMLIGVLIYGTLFSVSLEASLAEFINYLYALLLMVIIQQTVVKKSQIMYLIMAFVLSSVLVSGYGFVQYFSGQQTSTIWVDQALHPDIEIRITSLMANPNNFAQYMVLIIPFTMALFLYKRNWVHKLMAVILFGILIGCLGLTYSRSGFVAFVAGFAVFVILVELRLIIPTILAIPILILNMPSTLKTRIDSLVGSLQEFLKNPDKITDTSVAWRVQIFHGSLKTFGEFSWFGAGISNEAFKEVYPFFRVFGVAGDHAHNLFLELLIEFGIVGFTILFLFIIMILYHGVKVVLTTDNRMIKYFSGACIAGVLSIFVAGLAEHTWYYYKVFYGFFILLGILMALYNNDRYMKEGTRSI